MHSCRAVALLTLAVLPTRLDAQCPDGRQPPCAAARPPAATVPAAPAANTVAVLYFDVRDTADAFLAEGVSEEIATSLGRVPRLSVKIPSAVRRAQTTHAGDVRAMARALGVRWVVDGSLRRGGQQLRVSVRLVDADKETAAWSNAFTRSTSDLLTIQEEIAREVATGVVGALTPVERAAVAAKATVNPQAYEHYLKGNWYNGRRGRWVVRAVEEYREAARLDPAFQAPRAGIALAYVSAADYADAERFGTNADTLRMRALALADSVIQQDATVALAWAARSGVLRRQQQWAAARQAVERALALDANSPETQYRMGQYLWGVGEFAEARKYIERSYTLDPGRPVTHAYLGVLDYFDRRLPNALRNLDSALVLDPQFQHALAWKVPVLYLMGDTTRAKAAALERARVMAGDRAGIGAFILSTVDRVTMVGHGPINVLAMMGKHEETFGRLEQATFPGCRFIVFDPAFDKVRRDPRFVKYETECLALKEPR